MTTSEAVGLEFDLPDGWWCLDLREGGLAERLERFVELVADRDTTAPHVQQLVRAAAAQMRDGNALFLLVHPGELAICGGVFVEDPLPVPGDELYAALDAEGEAVALGDLDGVPIISHVRRQPGSDVVPVATVHITYLVCASGGCVGLTFAAPELSGVKRVVDEVACVVSAARVVPSAAGCPV